MEKTASLVTTPNVEQIASPAVTKAARRRAASRPWLSQLFESALTLGAVAVIFVQMVHLHVTVVQAGQYPFDFIQDWLAGKALVNGLPIYTPEKILAAHFNTGIGWLRDNALDAHPPLMAAIVAPLSTLSYAQATIWWDVFSVACLLLSIMIVGAELRWRVSAITLTCALSLLWGPLTYHLATGQLETLVGLGLTLAWLCYRRDMPVLGGLFLAIATLVKLFPGLLLIWLLVQRRWWAALWAALWMGLITSIDFWLGNPWNYVDFVRFVLPTNTPSWISAQGNLSVAGAVAHTLWLTHSPGDWQAPLTIGGSLLVLACLAVAWHGERDLDASFAIAIAGMLLLSPLTWSHYLVVLWLPFMVYADRLRRRPFGVAHLVAVVVALALIAVPLEALPHLDFVPSWLATIELQDDGVLVYVNLAGMVLLAVGLLQVARPPRRPPARRIHRTAALGMVEDGGTRKEGR